MGVPDGEVAPREAEVPMVEHEQVRRMHALAEVGWGVKRIARELGVARNDSSELTTRTESGGGLVVTGGIDRVGSAFHGKRDQTTTDHMESLAQRSELNAGRSSGCSSFTAPFMRNCAV